MSNVLLTGVSRGLGLETARVLLENGYDVYGVSRTRTEALARLEVASEGRLHVLPFDLGQADEVHQRIFKEWLPADQPLVGYVNNAAVAYDDLVSNLNLDRLREQFAVNVFTPMVLTKYAIRQMLLHRTPGCVIHVSSISVHTGYKGLAMYASTKGALEAFSKNTAREWGERKIRSNAVVAGFMETEMSATLSPEQRDRIYKRTSLKEPTRLASVAETIAFLLSPGAASITGQNLFVDAGTI